MKVRLIIALSVSIISTGLTVLLYFRTNIYVSGLFLFIAIISLRYTINTILKLFNDIDDFTEAVCSKDFTRRYPEKRKKGNMLYKKFNAISIAFFELIRTAEIREQYLQNIMELANTGILVYDTHTGEVKWLNREFINILGIPYIKNIHKLKDKNEDLYNKINDIPLGENRLMSINTGKLNIKVATGASHFQAEGKIYKVIAFHNVNETLEEIEGTAWKGLLNVMTHEIMNSIAPVASLSESLGKQLKKIKENNKADMQNDLDDIEIALETIHRRSEGLLHFSEKYRNLSKKIILETKSVNLYNLAYSIQQLMTPSLLQKGILLDLQTSDASVNAAIDQNLIEQTLINFITNAVYATKEEENPTILLITGITEEKKPFITVVDNGCGIPDDIRDKIFIPFFSTKKQGSGIGLSISREIIKLHKGNIIIQSENGKGSAFTILLKEKD